MENLTENERGALGKLKQSLVRDFRLVEIRLYGSKARGDATAGSDIDVLIVLDGCDWATRKAVSALCVDISLEFRVLLSPVIVTRAKLSSPLAAHAPFYRTVAREGLPV